MLTSTLLLSYVQSCSLNSTINDVFLMTHTCVILHPKSEKSVFLIKHRPRDQELTFLWFSFAFKFADCFRFGGIFPFKYTILLIHRYVPQAYSVFQSNAPHSFLCMSFIHLHLPPTLCPLLSFPPPPPLLHTPAAHILNKMGPFTGSWWIYQGPHP